LSGHPDGHLLLQVSQVPIGTRTRDGVRDLPTVRFGLRWAGHIQATMCRAGITARDLRAGRLLAEAYATG